MSDVIVVVPADCVIPAWHVSNPASVGAASRSIVTVFAIAAVVPIFTPPRIFKFPKPSGITLLASLAV